MLLRMSNKITLTFLISFLLMACAGKNDSFSCSQFEKPMWVPTPSCKFTEKEEELFKRAYRDHSSEVTIDHRIVDDGDMDDFKFYAYLGRFENGVLATILDGPLEGWGEPTAELTKICSINDFCLTTPLCVNLFPLFCTLSGDLLSPQDAYDQGFIKDDDFPIIKHNRDDNHSNFLNDYYEITDLEVSNISIFLFTDEWGGERVTFLPSHIYGSTTGWSELQSKMFDSSFTYSDMACFLKYDDPKWGEEGRYKVYYAPYGNSDELMEYYPIREEYRCSDLGIYKLLGLEKYLIE